MKQIKRICHVSGEEKIFGINSLLFKIAHYIFVKSLCERFFGEVETKEEVISKNSFSC